MIWLCFLLLDMSTSLLVFGFYTEEKEPKSSKKLQKLELNPATLPLHGACLNSMDFLINPLTLIDWFTSALSFTEAHEGLAFMPIRFFPAHYQSVSLRVFSRWCCRQFIELILLTINTSFCCFMKWIKKSQCSMLLTESECGNISVRDKSVISKYSIIIRK